MRKTLGVILLSALVVGNINAAELKKEEAIKIVKPFYQFLSGELTSKEISKNFSKDWKSYFGNGENDYRTFEKTTKFLGGPFRKMVPDLKWRIVDTKIAGDTIIVRGEGTGTTSGNVFITSQVESGKKFKMMTIDMHTIKDGKVVKTYHIEDWRTAFKQIGIVKPFKKIKK